MSGRSSGIRRKQAVIDGGTPISYRAWLYSSDENGNRVRAVDRHAVGYSVMPVRETNSWRGGSGPERDDHETRIARLTDEERQVLTLQGKLCETREVRLRIAVGDVAEYLRDGYTLVGGSRSVEERAGMPAIETREVVGYEHVQTDALDLRAIARELGLTVSQIHRRVKSAHRKLREATL